jgi:hypothetical protein
MKSLEQLINSNRERIDFQEPPDGHFLRFQGKLGNSKTSKRISIWKIAASLFFVVAFSLTYLLVSSSQNDYNLPLELRETAYYYNKQSENFKFKIEENTQLSSTEKKNLLKDVRDFEKEYPAILKELIKFPTDERLIDAFINYHKSRTEFLESILNQINGINLITI